MPTCEKCGNGFPNRFTIEGKRRSISKGRKYCFDCVPFGTHNTKNLTKQTAEKVHPDCVCSSCGRSYKYKRKGDSLNKCCSCWQSERRRRLKETLTQYKGGKCSVCGYDKCLDALTFHHLDPEKKDFHIGHSWNRSIDYLKTEADKCILLCANCHAEAHSKKRIEGPLTQ